MRLRSVISHARISRIAQLPSHSQNYRYEPLPSPDCIRLLEVFPVGTSVRCALKTFRLQEAPSFRALSYTWGHAHTIIATANENEGKSQSSQARKRASFSGPRRENPLRHSLICDGRLIKVASNLWSALRMLGNAVNLPQMPKTPSYYWIDKLCVNQEDIGERNTQVARMGDVFKKADGVVVWLGDEDEYTDDALATMRKISTIPEDKWQLIPYTSFYNAEESLLVSSAGLTFYNWLGFIALINRGWFERAWVNSPVFIQ